ncbi:MAG: SDR family NAD(P)-dependent oxidoreductase [Hyphomicrobiaceae bacterium]
MRFKDQVALITAAGAGIGKASAEIMAREGATVVALDVDKTRVEALRTASEAAGDPGKIIPREVDALNPNQANNTVDWTAQNCGRIDVLVNAVGGSTIIDNPNAATDELSLDDWQRLIAFNLDGTFLFTHAVIPVMKRQNAGRIVNLASIAGRGLSVNSSSAYAAAKGGIIALTKKLALELGAHNINVNAIAPSITLTERIRPHWERRTAESQAAEIARIPLGRVPEAIDQAKVICFLASSDADFVTGITIDVTGGL